MKVFVFNVSTFSNIERNYEGLYFVYFNFVTKKYCAGSFTPPQPPPAVVQDLASSLVKGFIVDKKTCVVLFRVRSIDQLRVFVT